MRSTLFMIVRPRSLALVGALLALTLSAATGDAQTTPGSDIPALITPAPLPAPFDGLNLPPGNPLRAPQTPRALGPVPSLGPDAPDGKIGLELSARFVENGPPVPSGLQWRVFHDEPDQNGDLPLADDSTDSTPAFRLSPGGYVIHAVYGLASVSKHVVVESSVREDIVLPAGALQLLAVVGERPTDKNITFKVTADQGGVERTVATDLTPRTRLRLPAGQYHVVSNYGDANAVVEVDVRVEAGKLVEATVHHKAAPIDLRLVTEAGQPVDNTSWSILTPGGDVVRESIRAQPKFILAEGKYLALARHDGRSYGREFVIVTGQAQQLDLVQNEATAVRSGTAARAAGPFSDAGAMGEEPAAGEE
jgi:hypothetical protein